MEFNQIIEKIQQLMQIESVKTAAENGMPFGRGVADALEYFLDLAKSLGFETKNYDNYIGEVIWGEGKKEMGVLCHLDVVPAGKRELWTHEPFGAEIENGILFGRGAVDDKSPAVLCLYAMKELRDEGFNPSVKIKLIVGCDEESGWACINYYKKVAKMPDYGFSPDADFPIIYAEKGILHLKFEFNEQNFISTLKGGERANMVADECSAYAPMRGHFEKFLMDLPSGEKAYFELPVSKLSARKYGLEVHADGSVKGRGKSAHGSTPEKGKNAILPVLLYLEEIDALKSTIRKALFEDEFGIKKFRDETGGLTMSPNMILKNAEKNVIYVTVDIRYPATYKRQEVLDAIDKMNLKYTIVESQEPLYNDKNGLLISTLLNVYNQETGEKALPVAIGGGTYAKALPVGAAFGPQFANENYNIHEPNEQISLQALEKIYNIYKKSIKRLSETDVE